MVRPWPQPSWGPYPARSCCASEWSAGRRRPARYERSACLARPLRTLPAPLVAASFGLGTLQPLGEWNPFDVLCERESDRRAHPDLALASDGPLVPVIGLVEVHPQTEYGDRARHEDVGRAIRAALAETRGAVVPIDTRLDANATGLRTAAEIESVIARCDVVVTTRLHGMVLALKNGVPAVVIDPIAGGAKVRRQAERLGWPVCFTPETAALEEIAAAVTTCLRGAMSEEARACANRARAALAAARVEFTAELDACGPTASMT